MTESTSPTSPVAATADQVRRLRFWFFPLGGGLFVKCRHLSMQGFMLAGTLPTALFDILMTRWAQMTKAAALQDPDRRRELLSVACAYACAAAAEPRVVMDTDPADPDALVVSIDPDRSEIPHDVLIDLMNEGMARRIGDDAHRVAEFSGTQSQHGAADRPDGQTLQPTAAPVAPGGRRRRAH